MYGVGGYGYNPTCYPTYSSVALNAYYTNDIYATNCNVPFGYRSFGYRPAGYFNNGMPYYNNTFNVPLQFNLNSYHGHHYRHCR